MLRKASSVLVGQISLRQLYIGYNRALACVNSRRGNSSRRYNLHHTDTAGSSNPAEAADAAATVLSDRSDMQKYPNKATWLDALKEKEKQEKEGKVIDSFSYVTPKTTDVGERTREDSFSYLELPFKDDKWLCDAYINAFGRLRVGQLFQDLDALAGRIAYRHCAPAEPVNVTASVDRIYMLKRADEISDLNVLLAGVVTWTGKSSMEISVKGYGFKEKLPEDISEGSLAPENVFLTANFTFVARNPATHKAFAVNRLLPRTEREWLDYRRAESRNALKKLATKTQVVKQPSYEEFQLVYDLWNASNSLDKLVGPLGKHISFMKENKVSSTLFMQPQYRNRHSYMIFGGYILRQAFELAYCGAAAFASAGPRFVSLDSTTFKSPVPVGAVLSMTASIAYTENICPENETIPPEESPFHSFMPATNKFSKDPESFLAEPGTLVQVKVDTSIRRLESVSKRESGTFIYSFFVPKASYKEGESGYSSIIPQTYSEMMEFIEGRRRAQDTANFVETLSR